MTTAIVGHTAHMKNDWYNHAQCAGQDPQKYDTDGSQYRNVNKAEVAQALCAGCPVKSECAFDAIDFGDEGVIRAGIWLPAGGLMQFQKDRLIDELARVATGEVE